MLQTLVVVTFWIIVFFIACAISPVVFFLMIIWTIYKIITVKQYIKMQKKQRASIQVLFLFINLLNIKEYGNRRQSRIQGSART